MGCLSRLRKGVNKMPEYTMKLNIPKLVDSDTFNTTTFGAIVDAIEENAADQLTVDEHIRNHTSHVPYHVTTGVANNYTVSIPKGFFLVEGLAIAVKINVNNTGISTINIGNSGAKTIKKANGNDVSAGQLKAGSIYTLRYNGTNFILQGEGGSGNAAVNEVLNGKTFSNDIGDQTGTMPNIGGVSILPSTTTQTIAAGYHNGFGSVVGDPDLIPANIKKDVNIFNVLGTFDGKRFATGSTTSLSSGTTVNLSYTSFGSSGSFPLKVLQINHNLGKKPSVMIVYNNSFGEYHTFNENFQYGTNYSYSLNNISSGYTPMMMAFTSGDMLNANNTHLFPVFNASTVYNWIAFE
jgi:hypothetical protein